jgi:hypothetical protein
MIKQEDFKSVKNHESYFIRDLGDNNTGFGQWVELVRKDGWGFGAMQLEAVVGIIDADEKSPRPETGSTLEAIFGTPIPEPEIEHGQANTDG